MRSFRRTFILVTFLALIPELFAVDLQQTLRDDYQGKILLIRGFYQDTNLHYDEKGAPMKQALTGSWTTSFVYIQEVVVSKKEIELKGNRVVQVGGGSTELRPQGIKLPIRLTVDRKDSPEEALENAVAKIFIGPKDPLADLVPPYWRSLVQRIRDKQTPPPLPVHLFSDTTAAKECEPLAGPEHPCTVGKKVKPPKALAAPEPKYEEMARASKYEGTSILWVVVDRNGNPQNIKIVRAIGFGLDDKAVEAVSHWKFSPATIDGNPVAVQINVEVNFRLY